MSDKKYRFETLQVRVGQEQPDPVTDARLQRFKTILLVAHNDSSLQQASISYFMAVYYIENKNFVKQNADMQKFYLYI